MLKKIVEIGDKIELLRLKKQELLQPRSKWYKSQLLDYKDDDLACIAMPIENGRIIPLDVNEHYQIIFYTKNGLFQCKAVIKDRYRSSNIYIAVIRLLSEPIKYQRRQFYRLSCVIECKLVIMEKDSETENIFPGIIIDISGGGCKLNTNTRRSVGEIIKVEFSLVMDGKALFYMIKGRVIHVAEVENRKNTFEHRLEFIDLKEEERECIVKYIFKEERKRRGKENGY